MISSPNPVKSTSYCVLRWLLMIGSAGPGKTPLCFVLK